jgi:GTP cyclohydrolase II
MGKNRRGMARLARPNSEDDLRRAEELVAEGRRIVQQQKGRIIRLRAAGVDTWNAQRAFHLFEANLRRFEEYREILKDRK